MNTMRGVFYRESLDTSPQVFEAFPMERDRYAGIKNFYVDEEDKLWVGIRHLGIYGYQLPQNELLVHKEPEQENFNSYLTLTGDTQHKDLLWCSSEKGLYRYDKKNNTGRWFIPRELNPEIPTNALENIMEGPKGSLWMTLMGSGIVCFDKEKETFEYFRNDPQESQSIIPGFITSISSSEGVLWLATSEGVCSFNLDTHKAINYYKSDSLFHYGIAAMVADLNGDLWIADNNGISHFDPETRDFDSYYCLDIAQGFTNGGGSRGRDGRIYFSSIKGLLSFHPDSIKLDTVPPKTVLTGIRVNNEYVDFGKAAEFVDTILLLVKIFKHEIVILNRIRETIDNFSVESHVD